MLSFLLPVEGSRVAYVLSYSSSQGTLRDCCDSVTVQWGEVSKTTVSPDCDSMVWPSKLCVSGWLLKKMCVVICLYWLVCF